MHFSNKTFETNYNGVEIFFESKLKGSNLDFIFEKNIAMRDEVTYEK